MFRYVLVKQKYEFYVKYITSLKIVYLWHNVKKCDIARYLTEHNADFGHVNWCTLEETLINVKGIPTQKSMTTFSMMTCFKFREVWIFWNL